jgi:hypothetical protein
MGNYRKLTQAELVAEARRRFGDDVMTWAFQCPNCGDIATAADFPEGQRERLGQECVGRHRGALAGPAGTRGGRGRADRGCDWCAYGLIPGPWRIVMPDGHEASSFALATAPVVAAAADGVLRVITDGT